MEFFLVCVDITLAFLPVALMLLVLSYSKDSLNPFRAAGVLFSAYAFDSLLRYLPTFFSSVYPRIGYWNWEGGILSFLWPWFIIFPLKWLSAEEMGVAFRKPVKGLLYGLLVGLVLGGWNIVDGYFLTELPSKHLLESIFFQLLIPSFSEELVFRGLFLAILMRYLRKRSVPVSFGWEITLVSLLFINVHLVNVDQGRLVWQGTLNLIGNVSIATVALAYLRIKTGSIWPCVLCHGLINTSPFVAAYLISS